MSDLSGLATWATDQQRGFQKQMAGAVRALKAGEPGAYVTLLSATAAYGFVHALGPGHGKYLVGGVGLGTSVSTLRLMTIAGISSLTQALWAVVLVYGGFWLIEASASQLTSLANDILAPASYLAIACVGLTLIWRGARSLKRKSSHHHHHAECGCHSHGPTPDQVARAGSFRDSLVLVLSIAVRPCTGAIFLLVIAWQMDIQMAGAAAVLIMGLGTAVLTSLVAVSSIAARSVAFASSTSFSGQHIALPALQIFAGALISVVSIGLLGLVP
ncbi:nickel/cobalt transporter [Actibacterium sp. 188UL27-1]|uniref:nickel/cobalt transporter n=1 Tax=Actibacterium sp. 188UL27-1 TaxID=2786961 RepID=UPI00195C1564|nr:hypothetical protein [Actibacterium sp. 188UL27-1]MBM7070334.1 hypothetical protein [Actibacterium sp. 188UL27-1]